MGWRLAPRRGAGRGRWAACCVAGALSSCTRVSDHERFAPDDEALSIVQTVPQAGAQGVARDATIDLCFSHVVDPRSVAPTDATMSSGETPLDNEVSLELLAWTGPGSAALDEAGLDAPWCAGSVLSVRPKAEMLAGLHYRLRLVPRAHGWGGELLDTQADGWTTETDRQRYYLEFTVERFPEAERPADGTGDDGPAGAEELDGPTLRELFDPGALFDPARPTCSCHRDVDDLALARLDLRDPEGAYLALVEDTRPRDTGFPMVAPRRPSESFLVQKLLRDHDGAALQGILGDAMPPDEEIPYADYVSVARWIAAGALP